MIDKKPGKDFHSEIDEAIDNLFIPFAQPGEKKPAPTAAGTAPEDPAPAGAVPQCEASAAPETAVALPQEYAAFEEALLSLEWEISAANIATCRSGLAEIQKTFDATKSGAVGEIFTLMEKILEAMSVAPQSVPTSAPKTLKEGLHTLLAVARAEDLSLLEDTLIDPTLSELRSAVPNIPKDYTKLVAAAPAGSEAKEEPPPPPAPEKSRTREPRAEAADLGLELPAAIPTPAPAGLAEAVNVHLTVLEKCIEKRIIPLENLFAKSPGYEKLLAIHVELRERLEKERQGLIAALAGDYRPGTQPPGEATVAETESRPCPWPLLATASWGGRSVAFVPEQIAYEAKPPKKTDAPFYALTNLKKGFFGKISPAIKGELLRQDESTLKALRVPVVGPAPGPEENTLLIACKGNCCLAFWLPEPSRQIEVPATASWTPAREPDSLFAGQLELGGKSLAVITIRSV